MNTRSPLVIAEAGVNHNGDLALAKEMVGVAAEAKADYIKFQAFRAETLAARSAAAADYQQKNAGVRDQQALLEALELDLEEFRELSEECVRAEIGFLVTPFDTDMAAPLVDMGMDRIKVSSGDLTTLPRLQDLARLDLPMIVSTGMALVEDVALR